MNLEFRVHNLSHIENRFTICILWKLTMLVTLELDFVSATGGLCNTGSCLQRWQELRFLKRLEDQFSRHQQWKKLITQPRFYREKSLEIQWVILRLEKSTSSCFLGLVHVMKVRCLQCHQAWPVLTLDNGRFSRLNILICKHHIERTSFSLPGRANSTETSHTSS